MAYFIIFRFFLESSNKFLTIIPLFFLELSSCPENDGYFLISHIVIPFFVHFLNFIHILIAVLNTLYIKVLI